MMTIYLPSVLLILITYATTFFKPYFFEAALSVNLTTLLVMTTIFMTVMQMLPATAYVKMIDIFLIFGQLYPFCEVILLTMMEYKREGDGSGEETPQTDSKEDTSDTGDEEKMDKPEDKLYWYKVTGGKNIENFSFSYFFFSSEEIILPGVVVLFLLGYTTIACVFYLSD